MSQDQGSVEIFNLQNLNKAGFGNIGVYVNLGYEPYAESYNPLPASEFDNYEPDDGFIKNTGLRTPLFTGAFKSSPLAVEGDYTYIFDSKGYSWLYNTFNTMAVTPFRRRLYPPGITQYSAALYGPPPAGSIQVVVNDKNQPQTFAARSADGTPIDYCFATDSSGNSFILGSVDTAYGNDVVGAFNKAVLPKGWKKRISTLDADFTINPGYGDGNRRIYNQFRDNITNNYFQFKFAANGHSMVRGIAGLPLSGGNGNEKIRGSSQSEILYGCRGNDQLIGGGGNDHLWGDDGDDIIQPGRGRNQLRGGSGQDTFKVSLGFNTIEDFSKQQGDVIEMRGLLGKPQITQTSEGVKLQTLGGRTLILGIEVSDLVAGQNLLV